MNWKTWTVVGVIVIALFAIYTFASPEPAPPLAGSASPASSQRRSVVRTPGVDPIHTEWLEGQTGSYSSRRNLFSFPAPPPPPPPPPPQPPPDRDGDGIPDHLDNCPDVWNPDQQDLDRDGIGTACETELPEIEPPPPEPQPPPFTYKYFGTFGIASNPIATFAREGEIVNARVGDIIEGKFILRSIGIESVEIGFTGFPPNKTQRVPIGQ